MTRRTLSARNKDCSRIRTSSQSSVEIQVSETATVITHSSSTTAVVTCTETSTENSQSSLVKPTPDFLQVLKTAGAVGEIFTPKEVLFHLKEYISTRKLFDPTNPRRVCCENDKLGEVFECGEFTVEDVIELLKKYTSTVESNYGRIKQSHLPGLQPEKRKQHFLAQAQVHDHTNSVHLKNSTDNITNQETVHKDTNNVKTQKSLKICENNCAAEVKKEEDPQIASTSKNSIKHSKQKATKRKREKSGSSSGKNSGRKKSSWSFTCTSSEGETGSYPLYFQVQVQTSDDNTSEVYSIQGYETAIVQSSSDDLWFLDDDDNISVEFESDGAFSVEYEVESDGSETYTTVDDDSNNSGADDEQEYIVAFDDSDVDFFADLSESESEESDMEISEQDKWRCSECDMLNSPLQRCCDRCWKLRPGWLPENRPGRRPIYKRSISAPGDLHPSSSPSSSNPDEIFNSITEQRISSSMASYRDQSDSDDECSSPPTKIRKYGQLRNHKRRIGRKQDVTKNEANINESFAKLDNREGDQIDVGKTAIEQQSHCEPVNSLSNTEISGGIGAASTLFTAVVNSNDAENKPTDLPAATSSFSFSDKPDIDMPPFLRIKMADAKKCNSSEIADGPTSDKLLKDGENKAVKMTLGKYKTSGSPQRKGSDTKSDTSLMLSSQDSGETGSLDITSVETSVEQSVDASGDGTDIVTPPISLSSDTQLHGSLANFALKDSERKDMLFDSGGTCSFNQILSSRNNAADCQNSICTTFSNDSFSAVENVETGPLFQTMPLDSGSGTESISSAIQKAQSEQANTSFKPRYSKDKNGDKFNNKPGPSCEPNNTSDPNYTDMCMICLSRPKEASIIHGRTGHQVCCFPCARRLRRRGKPCPVCRRPIENVIKNFLL